MTKGLGLPRKVEEIAGGMGLPLLKLEKPWEGQDQVVTSDTAKVWEIHVRPSACRWGAERGL